MCQLPASHQARHWYVKDRKKNESCYYFYLPQSVSRTVAELSNFAFRSKLSFAPCLPKIVIFISSDMILGGSLSPAIPLPTPKLVIQQVEDTIRTLGRSNDQSKRWYPSSQLGKPLRKTWYACAIRPVLDAWEFSGAFNSTSELWVFWELRINRTGSSPIIVPGPLIKLRATDERSKGYIFIKQTLRLSEFDNVL